MRYGIVCFVASLFALQGIEARADDRVDGAYFRVMNFYGTLMVYAEACNLETRYDLKAEALNQMPSEVNIVSMELDLDRAFSDERGRSGTVDCDPKLAKMYAGMFSRSMDDLVEAVNTRTNP